MQNRGEYLPTRSGKRFYPEDPQPEDLDIEDIAHALSRVCRYGGMVDDHYSVAQHSVIVSQAVVERCAPDTSTLKVATMGLWGLLHDASEAYLGDVVWPLKRAPGMAGYKALEEKAMRAVVTRFRLPPDEPELVKAMDLVVLLTEKRDLLGVGDVSKESEAARDRTGLWHSEVETPLYTRIIAWQPNAAKREFLRRYRELEACRG